MKARIFIYVVVAQIAIIAIIALQLKNPAVLGENASVNVIGREGIIYSQVDGLKHFYEPKPNFTQVLNLDWVNHNGPETPTYKINNDGMNQITNFEVKNPDKIFRIAAVGDSFTFGANVNTEDNYPSQLQLLLDQKCEEKFQVLNLGVGGYDIQYAVKRFRLRGEKYNPDLVLWLIIGDDLQRLDEILRPRSDHYYNEMKQTGELQKALEKGMHAPAWKKARDEIVSELGEDYILKLQKEYLEEFSKYYSNNLVMATFPTMGDRYKKFLQDFTATRDRSYYLEDIDAPNFYKGTQLPDGHPSPLGHKLIANSIFDFLIEKKLIRCN